MKRNKFLAFLLSFMVALGLWLYVVTFVNSEREETFYNIPVVLDNETALTSRGLMLTSEEIPTVTLKVHGRRSDVLQLSKENITIKANLATIYESGDKQLPYSIYYPFGMPSDAFTVVSQQPGLIGVQVERKIPKEVPVEVIYEGKMPDADKYICDTENAVKSSNVVNIQGPASVVDQIAKATIVVDMTDRVDSFSEDFVYTLCDAEGKAVDSKLITTDVASVNLTMQILRVKEVPLKVTVIDGGGATKETSEISMEPKTIKVSGTDVLLKDLNVIDLGTINLSELTSDTELAFAIKIPEGVNNLTNLAEAKVSVKFPNLLISTFNVTNIKAINVPEKLEHEIVTKEVAVRVRGPRDLVSQMTAADISIVIDFTDGQVGTKTMPGILEIKSEFAGVGALGSYSVSATLREKESH